MSEHYFSAQPSGEVGEHSVPLTVDGRQLELSTGRGVFSNSQVDAGTMVLLDNAPPPPSSGNLLDVGCGYGPILCTLALRSPGASVFGVDTNQRALELARANADALDLANVTVGLPDELDGGVRYDRIYSNPPIRIGKAALHELLLLWLGRLAAGGAAYLVVHKHLGSDSLQRWLGEEGFATQRLVSVRGFRVLAISPRER